MSDVEFPEARGQGLATRMANRALDGDGRPGNLCILSRSLAVLAS